MNIISKTPHLRKAALMLSLLIGLTPKLEAKLYNEVVPPTRDAAGLIEYTFQQPTEGDTLKKSTVEHKGGHETNSNKENHGTESEKGHHEADSGSGESHKNHVHAQVGGSFLSTPVNNKLKSGVGISGGLVEQFGDLEFEQLATVAVTPHGPEATMFVGAGSVEKGIGFGVLAGVTFNNHHYSSHSSNHYKVELVTGAGVSYKVGSNAYLHADTGYNWGGHVVSTSVGVTYVLGK